MAVELGDLLVGLLEAQFLLDADADAGGLAGAVFDRRRCLQDLAIEARDAVGSAGWHVELDIGDAEIDVAEAPGVRRVEAQLVAPRAGRLDAVVGFLELELGAL